LRDHAVLLLLQTAGFMRSLTDTTAGASPSVATSLQSAAAVVYNYALSVSMPAVTLQAVNYTNDSSSVLLELSLSKLALDLQLQHTHPNDWSGLCYTLQASASVAVQGRHTDGDEYFIEPAAVTGSLCTELQQEATAVRLLCERHIVLNVTTGLVETAKALATRAALQWSGCYCDVQAAEEAVSGQ
jgi:hypothetical protein